MNTATGIAVALAVVIALAFLFLGSTVFTPFSEPLLASPSMNSMEPVTELAVTDQTVGTGADAKPGDTVTVQYVGQLQDGTVFDASQNHGTEGFTFVLGAGAVIAGWDQGVAGMKEGGIRRLVIPASLGYGAQAVGPIPANSVLIFDVQLVKVVPAQ